MTAFWGLLKFLFVAGFVVTIFGTIILRLTDGNPLPRRVLKFVNGKRIWVNGYDSDVEFIYDPRDPAGLPRFEDIRTDDGDEAGRRL